MWNHPDRNHDLALTSVFGRNDPSMGPATNAGLAEGALMLASEHTIFSRVVLLEKTGQALALPSDMDDRKFGMASFTAGYVHDASRVADVVPGVGFVATVDAIGADLSSFYGTQAPWGGMVFVRLRAPEMKEHGAMGGHAMHRM